MPLGFVLAAGGLFAADTVLQLWSLAKNKENVRRITKVLLMPLLALTFYLLWCNNGLGTLPWRVIAAILLGCAGDAFLLDHHNPKGFVLGLISFAAGHILYIWQILSLSATPALWLVILLAAVYIGGMGYTYLKLTHYLPKKLWGGCLFYMLLLCMLSASAAAGMITDFSPGSLVLFAGSLSFLASDTILSFETFKKETKYGNLKVMATYIAAQLLLAAGFFLLSVGI